MNKPILRCALKKTLTSALAATLILAVPGLPCYEALARTVTQVKYNVSPAPTGGNFIMGPMQLIPKSSSLILPNITHNQVPGHARNVSISPSELATEAEFSAGKTSVASNANAAGIGAFLSLEQPGKQSVLPKPLHLKSQKDGDSDLSVLDQAQSLAPSRHASHSLGHAHSQANTVFDANASQSPDSLEPAVTASAGHDMSAREGRTLEEPGVAPGEMGPLEPPTDHPPVAQADEDNKFPRSIWRLWTGISLWAVANELNAILLTFYAFTEYGLAFAVIVSTLKIISIIPGSLMATIIAHRSDSRTTYIVGNLANAFTLISVPTVFWLGNIFSPTHFLLYTVVYGIAYGAIRGVGEQEITAHVVGQDNKTLLVRAKLSVIMVMEVVSILSGLASVFFMAAFSHHMLAAVTSMFMVASAISFFFVRYKQQQTAPNAPQETEKEGHLSKLPLRDYLTYIYVRSMHLNMYALFAPFFALEVFKDPTLIPKLLASYELGSFTFASVWTFLPGLTPNWSERVWSVIGVAATLAFLWATLLAQTPLLSIGLAALFGASVTANREQWSAYFQNKLQFSRQPKVFQNLMIAAVLVTLVPFAFLNGALLLSTSANMAHLLIVVAGGVGAASVVVLGAFLLPGKKS